MSLDLACTAEAGNRAPVESARPASLRPRGHGGALALLFLAALALRLPWIGAWLPYEWNPDEKEFLDRSIEMVRARTLNPDWFQQGSVNLYLEAAIVAAVCGVEKAFGKLDSMAEVTTYLSAPWRDATPSHPELWLVTRALLAAIGSIAPLILAMAGQRLIGWPAGLLAGWLLAVSPLHIFESHSLHCADSLGALFVCLALLRLVDLLERGELIDYVKAGAAMGAATAAKFTYGLITLLGPGTMLIRACVTDPAGPAVEPIPWHRRLAVAVAAAVLAFVVLTPYVIVRPTTFAVELRLLSGVYTNGTPAPGDPEDNRTFPFHDRFWDQVYAMCRETDLGLLAAIVACVALSPGRRRALASLMAAFSLGYCAFLGAGFRIYPRGYLLVKPMAFLFAACGVGELARRLSPDDRRMREALVLLAGAALIQANLRHDAVLAVEALGDRLRDSRTLAARWCREHLPPDAVVALPEEFRISALDWTGGRPRTLPCELNARPETLRARGATHVLVPASVRWDEGARIQVKTGAFQIRTTRPYVERSYPGITTPKELLAPLKSLPLVKSFGGVILEMTKAVRNPAIRLRKL